MSQISQILPIGGLFPPDNDDESLENLLSYFNGEEDLKQLLKSEEKDILIDDNLKKEINLTPPEIQRLTHDVFNGDDLLQTFKEVDLSEITEIGNQTDQLQYHLDTLDRNCVECVRYDKVTALAQIKPGDHIRFHRSMGVDIYNHHAIVISTDHNKEEMTLVHFQKKCGSMIVIKESSKFNPSENIDVVQYLSRPSFSSSKIVERANKMAEDFEKKPDSKKYSVFEYNCESVSNEIAVGAASSRQVFSKVAYVKSTIIWLLKLLLKIAVKVVKGLKSCIRGFAHVAVIASFLSLVDQIVMLNDKLKQGYICFKCFTKEHNKLMASLFVCLVTVGISVMCHVSWLYFGISAAVCLALPLVASFIIDTVMPVIQPASQIPKPLVRRPQMIRKGDVITFPYVGLYHEGIVTDILPTVSTDSDFVKVTLVHYNYPGVFGTRTVVEEDFFFNLKKQSIYVYNFDGENSYPAEEVVSKAVNEIGSKDFNSFTNTSSHLCRYCKTGKRNLKDLPYRKASEMTDISPGDIINFSYCWLPHDAVVIKVQYPDTIKCSVVHYNFDGVLGTRSVVEEPFIFKLENQNLFVHYYAECEVYDPEEVVRRARSKVGEQKFNTFTNRSSHLAQWCKLKK